MNSQTTRRVYSAEELHRLRNAYSLPKLEEAIEERDGEDAEVVKEHVLRGSKSFTARSFRSRISARSLRVPSTTSNNENAPVSKIAATRQLQTEPVQPPCTVLGEIAGNSQSLRPVWNKFGPSPTPSMKKKKAEAIVKAHGSPTHIRVTAGGRIVPSEQSPLCHPRYGYSAVKANGGLIKFAPNHQAGKAQWTRATENGFVAQDVHGNLCQIVNGMVLPLNQVDGALRLYIPAPNLKVTQRGSNQGPVIVNPYQNDGHMPSSSEIDSVLPPEPSIPSQISALELEYAKLEHDLKDVDKTEVIHGRTMNKVSKDALVSRRRELVINMDKLRKALKALKSQPPPDTMTSPRTLARVHNSSSPTIRHPTIASYQGVGESMEMQSHQHIYGTYANGPFPAHFNGSFNFHPVPAVSELYTNQPWGYGNPTIFVPSPGDGPLGASLPPFHDQDLNTTFQQMSVSEATKSDINVPQNDGCSSQAEAHAHSPSRSHAVPIRAPDNRANSQKSTLNPMSPAYKPALGAKPASHGSLDESSNSTASNGSSGPVIDSIKGEHLGGMREVTGGGMSPAKNEIHLQSSSISSFETADFFPRNTFEYSTRLRSPSHRHESIDDKENKDPEQIASRPGTRPTTPHQESLGVEWRASRSDRGAKNNSPQFERSQPPAPPPGTPVHPNDTTSKASTSIEINQALWYRKSKAVEHEVSSRPELDFIPKSGPGLISVEADIQKPLCAVDAALEDTSYNQNEHPHVQVSSNVIDFTRKPREWIEGYQAGLRRQPVGGDRHGEFLDGYCEGLLKSKPTSSVPSPSTHSTGSPTKSTARRPNPLSLTWSSMRQRDDRVASTVGSLIDSDMDDMAALKQAVIAPHNEDAILTPSLDERHASEYPFNHGTKARKRNSPRDDDKIATDIRFFSDTKATHTPMPVTNERRVASDNGKCSALQVEVGHPNPLAESKDHAQRACATKDTQHMTTRVTSPTFEETTIQPANTSSHTATRVDSTTGIDSTLNRPWSGNRVFGPHLDIKPTSSISRAASVATGFYAHAQFDGGICSDMYIEPFQLTTSTSPGLPSSSRITSAASTTVAPTNAHGRFHERPSNRVMSSPSTPPATSSTSSPKRTPANDSPRKKLGAHSKTSSPAKTTFDSLAGKVGIKVSPNVRAINDGASSPGNDGASPSGKRRWRDVWRGGVRKDDTH